MSYHASSKPWRNYCRHWTRHERTLLDIDEENWVYAHRLFQYLAVALHPLSVEELAEFLTFEFKDGESPIFQAECRPEDPREAVLSTCSSLITVIDDPGFSTVQFSHFLVKEFLTSTRITEGRVTQYYTPPRTSPFSSHAGVSFDSSPTGRSDSI